MSIKYFTANLPPKPHATEKRRVFPPAKGVAEHAHKIVNTSTAKPRHKDKYQLKQRSWRSPAPAHWSSAVAPRCWGWRQCRAAAPRGPAPSGFASECSGTPPAKRHGVKHYARPCHNCRSTFPALSCCYSAHWPSCILISSRKSKILLQRIKSQYSVMRRGTKQMWKAIKDPAQVPVQASSTRLVIILAAE